VNPDAVESGISVEDKPDFNTETADLRIKWNTRMFPNDILADVISTKNVDNISSKKNGDYLKLPGLNFINILLAPISYVSVLRSFL